MGTLERTWRWCRRNPRLAALTASVAVLLLAVAGISTVAAFWLKQERDTSRRAESAAIAANQQQTQAEAAQRRDLCRAYLNEASLFRFSAKSGQRLEGLNRIERVLATLQPGELTDELRAELRDAAISHLALRDVRRTVNVLVPHHRGDVVVHPSFEYFAAGNPDGPGTAIRKLVRRQG